MTAIHYLNFDLAIEPIESPVKRYRARVQDSPAGQASAEFELPFSEIELENFLLRIGRPRRGLRRLHSSEMSAARDFGGKLFATVFKEQVHSALLRSLDAVQQRNCGLRLRLHLPLALADLPWEYLYDAMLDRFFSNSNITPIVRYIDLPQQIAPLAVQPPIKVLVMMVNPLDNQQLDVEDEWRKVKNAVSDLAKRGLVTVTRLESGTLAALQRQLRRDQYHVFHYIGHGGFNRQTESGMLLLEDDNRQSRMVSGHQLGALLHDHPSLRLAFLNACEGARTARNDLFAGVAQHLVQQGIPAVIAMQFEITDQASILLSHEFFSALADGYPVDAALAEARKAIYIQGNDIEWGTPVLYLRAQDGQLFTITGSTQSHVLNVSQGYLEIRKSPDVKALAPPQASPTRTFEDDFDEDEAWFQAKERNNIARPGIATHQEKGVRICKFSVRYQLGGRTEANSQELRSQGNCLGKCGMSINAANELVTNNDQIEYVCVLQIWLHEESSDNSPLHVRYLLVPDKMTQNRVQSMLQTDQVLIALPNAKGSLRARDLTLDYAINNVFTMTPVDSPQHIRTMNPSAVFQSIEIELTAWHRG